MAYNIIAQGNNKTTYLKEFIVDTESEITELPTFPKTAIRSNCLVIETSDIYILGNDNEWHKV